MTAALTSATGFSLAFGVFQEYYGSHPDELDGDTSNVAVIGTTVTVSSFRPVDSLVQKTT